MHLLSIVIPVYNVQKYITKCINSILGQIKENPNVELIIVDDGSPDNSIDIIKPLIESCSNVRLISQQIKDYQKLEMSVCRIQKENMYGLLILTIISVMI